MTYMWGGLVCRVTQGFLVLGGVGGGGEVGGVRQTRNLYMCVARCVSELPGARCILSHLSSSVRYRVTSQVFAQTDHRKHQPSVLKTLRPDIMGIFA